MSPVTGRVHPRYHDRRRSDRPLEHVEAQHSGSAARPENPRRVQSRRRLRARRGRLQLHGASRPPPTFFDDPQLAAVFERGDDPHKLTASRVAGRPPEDDLRRRAQQSEERSISARFTALAPPAWSRRSGRTSASSSASRTPRTCSPASRPLSGHDRASARLRRRLPGSRPHHHRA